MAKRQSGRRRYRLNVEVGGRVMGIADIVDIVEGDIVDRFNVEVGGRARRR